MMLVVVVTDVIISEKESRKRVFSSASCSLAGFHSILPLQSNIYRIRCLLYHSSEDC